MRAIILSKNILALLLWSIFLLWLSNPAQAQEQLDNPTKVIDWRELKTEKFIIVYAERVEDKGEEVECVCGIEYAARYAAFIDQVYNDLAVIFGTELNIPVNLRLFPTEESYYEVNPLAEPSSGVVPHIPNSGQEIAIILPDAEHLAEQELTNNIRHELSRLFASLLSDGKLKPDFQEGLAQYLKKPSNQTNREPVLLRQAFQQERLLSWAELDKAEQVYSDPQVTYPQSLAIVSFLIDRYSFPTFIKFVKASAQEPGYRSALEATYGKSADELEAEWLAYLPEYFDSRWQINALYAYDLSRVNQLVEKGAYTDAAAELTEIIALLKTTEQHDRLAEAKSLLARAQQGQAASALAGETRLALEANDYALTINKGQAAIAAYEPLGYRDRIPEMELYIKRAKIGQQALERLDHGQQLLNSMRFLAAEAKIREATKVLQSLQNQAAARRGEELLTQSARRQSLLAYAILAVGLAILLFNSLRRIANRFRANPIEVEFT